MKIVISSEGKEETSKVSQASGRAPYYLIFEDSKLSKAIKSKFRIGGRGAGFSVAEMLSDEGVELVVSGKFGENIVSALKTKDIKYKEIPDLSVKEIVEKIKCQGR